MDQSQETSETQKRWRGAILFLCFLVAALAITLAIRPPSRPSKFDKIFEEMAQAGDTYDPAPLLELEHTGLKVALDRALPFVLNANIENGDEDLELIQEMEIGKWQAWGTGDLRRADVPKELVEGFVNYLAEIDDAESIRLITNRVLAVLKEGTLRSSTRDTIMKHSVATIVRSGNQQQLQRLTQLYNASSSEPKAKKNYRTSRSAEWLIELACHGRHRGFAKPGDLDSLVVAALRSDHARVVDAAISCCTELRTNSIAAETKTALTEIFQGEDQDLKFQSCFPLMYLFGYQESIDYLMEQVASTDEERSRTAIVWLGDTCNWSKPASPELLEALRPALRSENAKIRAAACRAIGTYSGNEVIKLLISMLGDDDGNITIAARRNLEGTLAKRNKALPSLLEEAANTNESEAIRNHCRSILDGLEQ